MLKTLAISNYRSLRDFVIPLGPLNLITGPNGSGKSNVYRALRLLADTARGGVVASLAREGGISSTLWAGPESFSAAVKRGDRAVEGTMRKEPVALRLGFQSDEFSYAIDLGLPVPSASAFARDPVIKTECIGDAAVLAHAINDAFPGSELDISASDGRMSVGLHQEGLLRPLSAAELSDGTLRYLSVNRCVGADPGMYVRAVRKGARRNANCRPREVGSASVEVAGKVMSNGSH
jgi:predicted ATPase